MIGLGLSIVQLAVRQQLAFNPASFFANGEQGWWYDPSNYGPTGTLFQDSAGTTPVTAMEQPVGLQLDLSKGLATSPTPIDGNMNTATWTKGAGWSAPSARSLICNGTQVSASDTSANYTKPSSGMVRYTFNITAISGTLIVYATGGGPSTFTTTGKKTVFQDNSSNFNIFRMSAGETCTITDIFIEIVPGNHRFQSTSANRPVVSARVNLLTKTEQLNDTTVQRNYGTVTANAGISPSGANNAFLFTGTGSLAGWDNFPSDYGSSLNLTQTFSISAKAGTTGIIQVSLSTSNASFNVSTGNLVSSTGIISASISSELNGWYRLSVTAVKSNQFHFWGVYLDNKANTTNSAFLWGADLRVSNIGVNLPVYQRVNTSTDYDSTGFPIYIKPNGSNQFMVTNSINFTATDKMTVWQGVRKLSDATTAILDELSTSGDANAGTFIVIAPSSSGSNSYRFTSGGSIPAAAAAGTGVFAAAPNTSVFTGLANISGDTCTLRINGTQVTASGSNQGTGNYGNYPAYFYARGGTSLFFNGNDYGSIARGAESTAAQIAAGEEWINSKTKAY
jgi:hypothetical protein